jgi:Flp pilus assembly protein TadD
VAHGDDPIPSLLRRRAAYPASRYPVQHATASFHLGVALSAAGRLNDAESALRSAVDLFDPLKLPVEHAKALVALGAALRAKGDLEGAAACFDEAASLFAANDVLLEQGAASFNLGLVHRETGRFNEAVESLEHARALLDPARVPGQAAAAARELGSALLQMGRMDEAAAVLQDAVSLAERAGDLASVGAAANALGLVHLGSERPRAAVDSFRSAAGANPRSVRPEAFAMAKANLALAYEELGHTARARLAAGQALVVKDAPHVVVAQASGVLQRAGMAHGDLLVVLGEEENGDRAAIVRDELIRWVDIDPDDRTAEAGAWIDVQVNQPERADEIAELMLGGLLELLPEEMHSIIRSVLRALERKDAHVEERFRTQLSSAMAHFPIPQWTRLRDSFNQAARTLGQSPLWT